MQEAEALSRRAVQAAPVVGRGLKQRHRPLHVGGDEVHGTVDRAVDMGFGGEMDHRMRPRYGKDATHRAPVSDIGMFQAVVRRIQRRTDGLRMSRIGQQVQGHDLFAGFHQPPHHTGADEARPAGHQYSFHASPTSAALG